MLDTDIAQEWHGTAVPGSVSGLRRAAAARARDLGFSDASVDDIAIAASEALANAVVHGFVESEPGTITISTAMTSPTNLRVTVTDDGSGMTPRPGSPGLGLGLPLMAELSDHLSISLADAGGTRVCMDFVLAGAEIRRPV
jgi:anti-sigma regulatory factor (Ser/Thr protein kinase)